MARQALVILFTVLAFGILVPWYKGFTFLDPRMLAAYGCLAILFVAPASAESFAGSREITSRGAILGRLATLIGFGWGITVLVLLTGLATLNLTYWHGELIKPPGALFAAVLLCSLAACLAVGSLAALLARTLPATAVKTILRFSFLAVLLAFAFSQRMPDEWQIWLSDHTTRRAITTLAWQGAVVSALASAILLIVLLKKSTAR
jgi:ABC-2 type transport system permease protein